jgi:hypothetical protein
MLIEASDQVKPDGRTAHTAVGTRSGPEFIGGLGAGCRFD